MYQVILFTNRNLLVWDEEGKQCDLQDAVDCYTLNQEVLDELLSKPATYYISRWREWKHEITKKEFEYLLGQRTREKDLEQMSLVGEFPQ